MTDRNSTDRHDLPADLVREWRADAHRKSQRTEGFWTDQELKIHTRIQAQADRRPRPLWLAAATVALVFLAVLLVTPAGPRPPQPPHQSATDADQELLLAVERALATGTPESLEPVTLLVESSSNPIQVEPITPKEHLNEN